MTTGEFAEVIIRRYAIENGVPVRSTSDTSPFEQWLIIKLMLSVHEPDKKVAVDVEGVFSEALSISRWNEDETALTSVLTTKEMDKIIIEIGEGLIKAGYKIVKSGEVT